jgi:hypothetical protein
LGKHELAHRLLGLDRELVGKHRLLEMRWLAFRQHVGDGRGEMVADVIAKEAQHRCLLAARYESVAHEADGVCLCIELGNPQAVHLFKKAARMDVPRHRLRKRFEAERTGRRAHARKNARRADSSQNEGSVIQRANTSLARDGRT